MGDKKKKHFTINVKNITIAAATTGLLASAAVGGLIANKAYSAEQERIKYDTAVEEVYEQKIDLAKRDFEYQEATQKSLGQLPDNYNSEQALEQFLKEISQQKMNDAHAETEKPIDIGERTHEGVMLGVLFGAFVAAAAGHGAAKGANKLNERIARKKTLIARKKTAKIDEK